MKIYLITIYSQTFTAIGNDVSAVGRDKWAVGMLKPNILQLICNPLTTLTKSLVNGFFSPNDTIHHTCVSDSPVTVNMRIRHYFQQLTQNSSYDLQSDSLSQAERKSSTLPKQTREKTSQTSPKKPLRSTTKKSDQGSDQDLGSRTKQSGKRALNTSQSLRISSSVPTLGQAKGFAETDPKVT